MEGNVQGEDSPARARSARRLFPAHSDLFSQIPHSSCSSPKGGGYTLTEPDESEFQSIVNLYDDCVKEATLSDFEPPARPILSDHSRHDTRNNRSISSGSESSESISNGSDSSMGSLRSSLHESSDHFGYFEDNAHDASIVQRGHKVTSIKDHGDSPSDRPRMALSSEAEAKVYEDLAGTNGTGLAPLLKVGHGHRTLPNKPRDCQGADPDRTSSLSSAVTALFHPLLVPGPHPHTIPWTAKVIMHASVSHLRNGWAQTYCWAEINILMKESQPSEELINILVMVRNGLSTEQQHELKPGQRSLFFLADDREMPPCHKEIPLYITFVTQDLAKPLHLCFSVIHGLKGRQVTSSIPVLRPDGGELLSEIVFVRDGICPLIVKAITRSQLSTWSLVEDPDFPGTILHRNATPRLYPTAFKDDIQWYIEDTLPLSWGALKGLNENGVVYGFKLYVDKLLGGHLVCGISLVLVVGVADRLLNINFYGWTPEFSTLNGMPVTDEWRSVEGMTLYKQSWMQFGAPLQVNVLWHLSSTTSDISVELPRVTNRAVMPGRMTCRADRALILREHIQAIPQTYTFDLGESTQLPALYKGYEMHLVDPPEEEIPPLPPLPTLFESDEPSESDHETQRVSGCETTERHTENKDVIATRNIRRAAGLRHFCRLSFTPLVLAFAFGLFYSECIVIVSKAITGMTLASPVSHSLVHGFTSQAIRNVSTEVVTPPGPDNSPTMRDQLDCMLGWGGKVCQRN